MLWINYLDTGSEGVHTSPEGSFRMEGWRGGGDEEECGVKGCFQGRIHHHRHPSFLQIMDTSDHERGNAENEEKGDEIRIWTTIIIFIFVFNLHPNAD